MYNKKPNGKHAGVMELVDVTDSKSVGLIPRVGSSPTTGTKRKGHPSGCPFFLITDDLLQETCGKERYI